MQHAMPIGDLAAQAGVNTKTIRYYESIGLLSEPARTAAGHRRYGATDTERLTFIKTAQRLGLTLDEIREILALRDRGQQPCAHVRQVLRDEVTRIEQRIAELDRLRGDLLALDRLADDLPDTGHSLCRIIDHVRLKANTAAILPRRDT